MKLKLIHYVTGPSKADNEFIWVDSKDNDREFSPIFSNEDSAIMWHSMMQSYFCPNKNCTVRDLNHNEILENGWISSV